LQLTRAEINFQQIIETLVTVWKKNKKIHNSRFALSGVSKYSRQALLPYCPHSTLWPRGLMATLVIIHGDIIVLAIICGCFQNGIQKK
jgi:hypothetical protein